MPKVYTFVHVKSGDVLKTAEEKLEPLACQLRKRAAQASKAKAAGKKVNEKHLTAPAWTTNPGDYRRESFCEMSDAEAAKETEEGGEEALPELSSSDRVN